MRRSMEPWSAGPRCRPWSGTHHLVAVRQESQCANLSVETLVDNLLCLRNNRVLETSLKRGGAFGQWKRRARCIDGCPPALSDWTDLNTISLIVDRLCHLWCRCTSARGRVNLLRRTPVIRVDSFLPPGAPMQRCFPAANPKPHRKPEWCKPLFSNQGLDVWRGSWRRSLDVGGSATGLSATGARFRAAAGGEWLCTQSEKIANHFQRPELSHPLAPGRSKSPKAALIPVNRSESTQTECGQQGLRFDARRLTCSKSKQWTTGPGRRLRMRRRCAGPAEHAVHTHPSGRDSPWRMTPCSIAFRPHSSMTSGDGCAAMATAVQPS